MGLEMKHYESRPEPADLSQTVGNAVRQVWSESIPNPNDILEDDFSRRQFEQN